MSRMTGRLALVLAVLAIAVVVIGTAARPMPVVHVEPLPATPVPRTAVLDSAPDGQVANGFAGVLVQRTTHFATRNTNDSIPDFDRQVYDTDGAWSPKQPDRLVIPAAWDGRMVIITVRAAWAGHSDRWVELKLYRNAARPIGNDQEERLLAVVQLATNPDSPFVELTTPPLLMHAGDELFIALKTPAERLAISYQGVTTLFGAYVVGG